MATQGRKDRHNTRIEHVILRCASGPIESCYCFIRKTTTLEPRNVGHIESVLIREVSYDSIALALALALVSGVE